MSTAPAPSRQRSVASGIQIQLGLLNVALDAVPVRRPNLSKSGFARSCPGEHDSPTRVSQVYTCEDGHGPFREDQLGRCRDLDGTLVAVTDEEYETAVGAEVPKGEWALRVFPAAQVEAVTRPDEAAYRMRPPKGMKGGQAYGVLLAIAGDPKYAVVGEMNIKGGQRPYRLTAWKGMLVAQSLIRPEDLAEVEGVEAKAPDTRTTKLVDSLLKSQLEEFAEDTFRNLRRQRLEALDEAKRTGAETPVPVAKTAAQPEADILSLLEASIDKAKAVPSRRRSARKAEEAA